MQGGSRNYSWMLNETDRENGITNLGAHTRLRVALDKMVKGDSRLIHVCIQRPMHD